MPKKGKGLLVALGLGDGAEGGDDDSNGLCGDILQAIKDRDESALGDALDAYIGDYIDGLRGEGDEDSE